MECVQKSQEQNKEGEQFSDVIKCLASSHLLTDTPRTFNSIQKLDTELRMMMMEGPGI